MANFRAFGVGCFYFNYKKALPFEFNSDEYFMEIERALRSLPSIDEVEVSFDKGAKEKFEVVEKLASIDDPDFLHLHFYEIDFLIRIPARVARDLFPNERVDQRVGTEQFRVTVQDGFHGPVAFVECIDPDDECVPSSAVRLVREFLEREFEKVSTPVVFEYLGPAPFHADFFVRQGERDGIDFEIRITAQRGYDFIELVCDSELALEDALRTIYRELIRELDVFYDFQRSRSKILDAGGDFVEEWYQAQSLVHESTSMWNLRQRVRIHHAARSVAIHGYSLQARLDVDSKQLDQNVNHLYAKGVRCYLESYLRALKFPEYPVASIIKWAERVEDGSFKQAEIQAVIVSALAGGVVGALVTKLF